MGSIGGSVIVQRPPVTVTVAWEGPGRSACSPPDHLTATVNVPGAGGPEERTAGTGGGSRSFSSGRESDRSSILLGYDLYRATEADPSHFVKINPVLIPAGTANFLDENPPAGSVAYRVQAVYDDCSSNYSPPAPTQVPPCAIGCSASCDPPSGAAPLVASFSGAAYPSSGCSGEVAYAWDFGDGATSTEKNPQHTYASDGAYPWTLTVNAGGVFSSNLGVVAVGNACAVSCRASAKPSSGQGPLAVDFTAAATPGAYCAGPLAYSWTFGDGDTSTIQNPAHTYLAQGDYTWELTVTSGTGSSHQTGVIRVCSLACSASASPGIGLPPLSVNFGASSVISPNCQGAAFYSWAFGDGQTSIAQNPTHVYGSIGIFHWTVTATANGMVSSQTGTVQVYSDPPVVTAVKRLARPARLRVDAERLKEGFQVYLWIMTTPWPHVMVKSPTCFILKNVSDFFPNANVWVPVRIVNPDGSEGVIEYNWGLKEWRPAR